MLPETSLIGAWVIWRVAQHWLQKFVTLARNMPWDSCGKEKGLCSAGAEDSSGTFTRRISVGRGQRQTEAVDLLTCLPPRWWADSRSQESLMGFSQPQKTSGNKPSTWLDQLHLPWERFDMNFWIHTCHKGNVGSTCRPSESPLDFSPFQSTSSSQAPGRNYWCLNCLYTRISNLYL